MLSVIVVSWNTREVLRGCLAAVRQHLGAQGCELLVIDNASSDGSAEMVEAEFPEARLRRNADNLGFGRAANQGMQAAAGDWLLLLNSDAYLLDGRLPHLVARWAEEPQLGVIGPRVELDEGGQLQSTARRFPSLLRIALAELWLYRLLSRSRAADALLGPFWSHESPRDVDWLVGACLLVRREVFAETGGFDPAVFMYGEEVEWCHRIRARGWRIVFDPSARVLHLNHKSADRLFGDAGRIDRCLVAEDDLLRRWQGRAAPALAGLLRMAGALLRLAAFAPRRLLRPEDRYAEELTAGAWALLAHYGRRLRGATWQPR